MARDDDDMTFAMFVCAFLLSVCLYSGVNFVNCLYTCTGFLKKDPS